MRFLPALIPVLLLALASCGGAPSKPVEDNDTKFRRLMSGGITLVGRSSSTRSDRISTEERYTISSVTKVGGETWLLTARFKYKDTELPIPVPVTIKWVDDTPVICMTDVAVPGMGSYSARVVLDKTQYAGTWSGKGGNGGQVFGRIVPGSQAPAAQ